jgi:hypothetical protein
MVQVLSTRVVPGAQNICGQIRQPDDPLELELEPLVLELLVLELLELLFVLK